MIFGCVLIPTTTIRSNLGMTIDLTAMPDDYSVEVTESKKKHREIRIKDVPVRIIVLPATQPVFGNEVVGRTPNK